MGRSGIVAGAIGVTVAAVGLVVTACGAGQTPQRPKIFGITGVEILSTKVQAAKLFYGRLVELDGPCNWCENNPYRAVMIPSGQIVEVSQSPRGLPSDMMVSISFAIDSLKEMRQWLKANHVAFRESTGPYLDWGSYLSVVDPEGHHLYFRKRKKGEETDYRRLPLLDTGFVVKDRAAMDKFYHDVLGFHLYWHGGMKDGETDWVDMQVPDGTDWIEYMLNVPANAEKRTLGAMNHIAFGVPDVREAAEQLEAEGVSLQEEPKIGRDGKWELNLYDPDETRVVLMEFTPVEKPCCAEYTGSHPKP